MKNSYTFKKSSQGWTLTQITTGETLLITSEHPKCDWIHKLAPDRLININQQGHWTSSKDYVGAYSKKAQVTTTRSKAIQLTKLDDLQINDSLFIPMATNTIFDKFVSSESGFLPGTNIMAAGAPGVGKCVRGNTMIKLRNKNTDKTIEMTIEEFHKLNR